MTLIVSPVGFSGRLGRIDVERGRCRQLDPLFSRLSSPIAEQATIIWKLASCLGRQYANLDLLLLEPAHTSFEAARRSAEPADCSIPLHRMPLFLADSVDRQATCSTQGHTVSVLVR